MKNTKRAKKPRLPDRIALWLTLFFGSVNCIYWCTGFFSVWMMIIEKSPWPTLTLIVSLAAIYMNTFIMIGQNIQGKQAEEREERMIAKLYTLEKKIESQQLELKTLLNDNTEATKADKDLTASMGELVQQIHTHLLTAAEV